MTTNSGLAFLARLMAAAALMAALMQSHAGRAAGGANPPIRVGYFELAPHARMQGSQSVGPAIEYFNQIAAQMGLAARYVQLPLSRLVANPDVDVILFLGKTAERERRLVFASQPLLQMQGAVAVRSDSPLTAIGSARDLVNLQIGVYQDGYLSPLMRDPRLHTFKMPSDTLLQRGIQMLMRGRIDAFYCPDHHSLQEAVEGQGLSDALRLVLLPPGQDQLFTAFTPAGARKYLAGYEAAHRSVSARLDYEQLLVGRKQVPARAGGGIGNQTQKVSK